MRLHPPHHLSVLLCGLTGSVLYGRLYSLDCALDLFMRKLQCFSAFTEPAAEARSLDVFSLHMCSSLHQKQRKPQEIAACISRKLNYITGCPSGAAQNTPV